MRWLKWIPVVIVVLFAAAASSLWAHQVVAERSAHSAFLRAQSDLSSDIRLARTDGVFPSELRHFSMALAHIQAIRPPKDGTFWSTDTGNFYSKQSAEMNALGMRLHKQVAHLSRQALKHVHWVLWKFGREIHMAHQDGLPLAKQTAQLKNFRLDLQKAHTIGEYRALAGSSQPKMTAVAPMVKVRDALVQRLIKRVAGSKDRMKAAEALVTNKDKWTLGQVGRLTLFDKKQTYAKWLGHVDSWAVHRKSVRWKVIGAADILQIAAQVHVQLQKLVPDKWILVSTEGQWVKMYDRNKQVNFSWATTGGPQLPTDHGNFHIYEKISPFTFISPWPEGSQYYYSPSPVTFWMPFYKGEGLHDAPWRSDYGPGSNYLPTPGTQIDGTHGCVNLPYEAAAWIWDWAPVGTPVIVI